MGTSSPAGLGARLPRLTHDEGDSGGGRPLGHCVLKVAELLMLDEGAHPLKHPFLCILIRGVGSELQHKQIIMITVP